LNGVRGAFAADLKSGGGCAPRARPSSLLLYVFIAHPAIGYSAIGYSAIDLLV
jgi:hypothetical protein